MDDRPVLRNGSSTNAAAETVDDVHSAKHSLHPRPGLSEPCLELKQLHYAVLVDGLDPATTANDFQALLQDIFQGTGAKYNCRLIGSKVTDSVAVIAQFQEPEHAADLLDFVDSDEATFDGRKLTAEIWPPNNKTQSNTIPDLIVNVDTTEGKKPDSCAGQKRTTDLTVLATLEDRNDEETPARHSKQDLRETENRAVITSPAAAVPTTSKPIVTAKDTAEVHLRPRVVTRNAPIARSVASTVKNGVQPSKPTNSRPSHSQRSVQANHAMPLASRSIHSVRSELLQLPRPSSALAIKPLPNFALAIKSPPPTASRRKSVTFEEFLLHEDDSRSTSKQTKPVSVGAVSSSIANLENEDVGKELQGLSDIHEQKDNKVSQADSTDRPTPRLNELPRSAAARSAKPLKVEAPVFTPAARSSPDFAGRGPTSVQPLSPEVPDFVPGQARPSASKSFTETSSNGRSYLAEETLYDWVKTDNWASPADFANEQLKANKLPDKPIPALAHSNAPYAWKEKQDNTAEARQRSPSVESVHTAGVKASLTGMQASADTFRPSATSFQPTYAGHMLSGNIWSTSSPVFAPWLSGPTVFNMDPRYGLAASMMPSSQHHTSFGFSASPNTPAQVIKRPFPGYFPSSFVQVLQWAGISSIDDAKNAIFDADSAFAFVEQLAEARPDALPSFAVEFSLASKLCKVLGIAPFSQPPSRIHMAGLPTQPLALVSVLPSYLAEVLSSAGLSFVHEAKELLHSRQEVHIFVERLALRRPDALHSFVAKFALKDRLGKLVECQ